MCIRDRPSPIGKDLGKCHFEAEGINKYMEHAKSTIATELAGLKVALEMCIRDSCKDVKGKESIYRNSRSYRC